MTDNRNSYEIEEGEVPPLEKTFNKKANNERKSKKKGDLSNSNSSSDSEHSQNYTSNHLRFQKPPRFPKARKFIHKFNPQHPSNFSSLPPNAPPNDSNTIVPETRSEFPQNQPNFPFFKPRIFHNSGIRPPGNRGFYNPVMGFKKGPRNYMDYGKMPHIFRGPPTNNTQSSLNPFINNPQNPPNMRVPPFPLGIGLGSNLSLTNITNPGRSLNPNIGSSSLHSSLEVNIAPSNIPNLQLGMNSGIISKNMMSPTHPGNIINQNPNFLGNLNQQNSNFNPTINPNFSSNNGNPHINPNLNASINSNNNEKPLVLPQIPSFPFKEQSPFNQNAGKPILPSPLQKQEPEEKQPKVNDSPAKKEDEKSSEILKILSKLNDSSPEQKEEIIKKFRALQQNFPGENKEAIQKLISIISSKSGGEKAEKHEKIEKEKEKDPREEKKQKLNEKMQTMGIFLGKTEEKIEKNQELKGLQDKLPHPETGDIKNLVNRFFQNKDPRLRDKAKD